MVKLRMGGVGGEWIDLVQRVRLGTIGEESGRALWGECKGGARAKCSHKRVVVSMLRYTREGGPSEVLIVSGFKGTITTLGSRVRRVGEGD